MSNTQGKEHLTVRLPAGLLSYVRSQPNMSKYIEGLVKKDLQAEKSEDIYTAMKSRLMRDTEFLQFVQDNVSVTSSSSNSPIATTRTKSTIKADIDGLEAERNTMLEHMQDAEEIKRIGNEYQSEIDALWKEFHAA